LSFENCPFCKSESIGKVRRNFYKCYGCRREWSIRKVSILLSKFILAIKLFILEVPVNKAYKGSG
jgi:transposase